MKSSFWREIWPVWGGTVLVLAALAFAMISFASSHSFGAYWDYVSHPSLATGTVLKPAAPETCLYQFEFENGVGKSKGIGSDCQAAAGQQRQIYFSPSDPTLSTTTPPLNGFLAMAAFVLVAILAVGLAISTVIWQHVNQEK